MRPNPRHSASVGDRLDKLGGAASGEFRTVQCSFERFRAAEPRSELL
jgi:hypothetical protein